MLSCANSCLSYLHRRLIATQAEYAKAEEKFDKTQAKGQAASKKGEKACQTALCVLMLTSAEEREAH